MGKYVLLFKIDIMEYVFQNILCNVQKFDKVAFFLVICLIVTQISNSQFLKIRDINKSTALSFLPMSREKVT